MRTVEIVSDLNFSCVNTLSTRSVLQQEGVGDPHAYLLVFPICRDLGSLSVSL